MLNKSALGKKVTYKSVYDASLLLPVPRAANRATLGIDADLPFKGVDIWNAYEVSWLNAKGKPEVAIAEFIFPCNSLNVVESKAFKLYLNSFNQTRFTSKEVVRNIWQHDLSAAVQAKVQVTIHSVNKSVTMRPFAGFCLDELDISADEYSPNPKLLLTYDQTVSETLYSNLLKSNCPITGQPDWASIVIDYQGKQIEHTGLLKYLISYRQHQDFHEHCVEHIYMDILRLCQPEKLSVYARYTRRGGLDINPFRSNFMMTPTNMRLSRQ